MLRFQEVFTVMMGLMGGGGGGGEAPGPNGIINIEVW